MVTRTTDSGVPPEYDPSQFPAFAVTVDVVILTMAGGMLNVLLVRRGEAPLEDMWAIPGGFKRPTETLDEAAKRELREETGVDAASVLAQFGAYGDPGRDPRMNVVTVAYLAVLRDVGDVMAGTDAADAGLTPVSDVLNGKLQLAFDHQRIVRDAIERVRVELEASGMATAFVGTTFTMAELRTVYEAIYGSADGAFAEGNSPQALAVNYDHLRLYVTSGDGVNCPEDPVTPGIDLDSATEFLINGQ